jgi:hypothetical protein
MEMPDLPPAEKSAEQRKALKWWIQHSHVQEEKIEELRASLRDLLPIAMKFYSQEMWAASWMQNLEDFLTNDNRSHYTRDIARAAGLLGEVPFWDDNAPEDEDGMNIGWRKYPLV